MCIRDSSVTVCEVIITGVFKRPALPSLKPYAVTVSYTHLDVYKRQLYTYNPPRSAREWVNEEALVPREGRMRHHSDYRGTVSYTHLDVYKRQGEMIGNSFGYLTEWAVKKAAHSAPRMRARPA